MVWKWVEWMLWLKEIFLTNSITYKYLISIKTQLINWYLWYRSGISFTWLTTYTWIRARITWTFLEVLIHNQHLLLSITLIFIDLKLLELLSHFPLLNYRLCFFIKVWLRNVMTDFNQNILAWFDLKTLKGYLIVIVVTNFDTVFRL